MTHRPIIVLDLECIANQALASDPTYLNSIRDNITAPSNYKAPDKILAWETAAVEKEISGMALQWFRGQVVAIAWRDLDADKPYVTVDINDEVRVLETFAAQMDAANEVILAGFNVRQFDVPYLTLRCAVHGIGLPNWWPCIDDRRSWYEGIIDARDWLPHAKGKLDDYLRAFNLPVKSSDGSKVATMTEDELREYSTQDINVTTQLLRRMAPTFQKLRGSTYDDSVS